MAKIKKESLTEVKQEPIEEIASLPVRSPLAAVNAGSHQHASNRGADPAPLKSAAAREQVSSICRSL